MSGLIAFFAVLAVGAVLIYAAWPKESDGREQK